MKRRFLVVLGVLVFLAVLLPGSVLASEGVDYRPVDAGPALRAWEATPDRIQGGLTALAPEEIEALEAEAMAAAAGTPYFDCILDAKFWLALDNFNGFYFFDVFYLVADTPGSQLWVQDDLSWPAGDPRPTPVITCEQAAYMLGEFDSKMYPVETDFFGMPDFHDGSLSLLEIWGFVPPGYYADPGGRQVVLVENVRDENYYDPNFPLYIAGFYSDSLEGFFDRNTMSIDAYDWENRTGPDSARPFLYEGVFAHEYQHLLHSDYDSDEESFVNEGLSDLAEYLVGYGLPDSHVAAAASNPENSLVVWEDQGGLEILTDYGQAFLFQFYLMEKFGPAFIQAEFLNPANGMAGVDATLDAFNIQRTFGDIYHDFSVAMMIDQDQWKGGRYGFEAFSFNLDLGTPGSPNPEAYDTPGAPPWGTDYIWIEGDPKDLAKFTFNGLDYTAFPTAWTSDGDVLYGGTGDLIDNWAIFEATGGGTLTFDTQWDIEDFWDFGFVQVSTDGGYTWTSLANAYTTDVHDPNAHPDIVSNLPGLTGSSGGWINVSFDLSAYSGDILLAFRYMTDWAFNLDGWYIDNVYVDSTLISDGSDASIFTDITELFPVNNDFTVTFVGIKDKNKGNQYKVHTMKLSEVTEDGIFELNKVLSWSDQAVMLVTFDAPEGFTGYADYTYDFTYINAGPKK